MPRRRRPEIHRFAHESMTTVFEVIIAGKDKDYARQAAGAAFDEIDRIGQLFNRFDPSSEISRIGRLRPGESMRVGIETYDCLALAACIQVETNGAFDVNFRVGSTHLSQTGRKSKPTAGLPWGGRAGIAEKQRLGSCCLHFPSLADLLYLRKTPDGFEAERPAIRARKNAASLDLDLGAIGKGYSLDSALGILGDWEIGNVLLHAGTSSALAVGPGPGAGAAGWPVGVATAWSDVSSPKELLLRDRALSGSGTEVKGAHIIDPRTGLPANGHPAAWACHSSAAVSDALSTAFMVMTTDEIAAYCRRRRNIWALVILDGKKCRIFNAKTVA